MIYSLNNNFKQKTTKISKNKNKIRRLKKNPNPCLGDGKTTFQKIMEFVTSFIY